MHKRGFTLVEILIAVAIIGIVAALTIPSLSKAYQKKVLTTQLQRAYAEISHAAKMVLAEEMTDDFKYSKAIKDMTFLGKYLIISQNRDGFAKTYGFVDNEDASFNLMDEVTHSWVHPHNQGDKLEDDEYKCGITKAGAAICLNKFAIGILDVNGAKGPNLIGRDAFTIGFLPNGTIDAEGYSPALENIIWNNWDLDKTDFE